MNVEIGTEAAQFPEKEYINGLFLAVQPEDEEDLPGVRRMGNGQDLKNQDGGADQGGHHQRRGPVLLVGSLAYGGWAKDRT
jgi:hypothetical protein